MASSSRFLGFMRSTPFSLMSAALAGLMPSTLATFLSTQSPDRAVEK
jgi:hypothetical protein